MEHRHAAWLVDLDGTLYQAKWVKLAMALELAVSGWGSVATLRRFRHEHEALREDQKGGDRAFESPFAEQVERTARALGKSTDQVEQTVTQWMIERPAKWLRRFRRDALVAEIEHFRTSGGKTALVSDYPAQTKLRALELEPVFDVVVANGEPGGPRQLKPAPGGYLDAAQRLEVAPEKCLVIGDRDDADGEAARAAGMAFRLIR